MPSAAADLSAFWRYRPYTCTALPQLPLLSPLPTRRDLAMKFGATNVIDPMAEDVVKRGLELTGGLGYDVVIDCSGSPKAAYPLPQIAAKGGKLIYAAMYPNDWEMP